MEAKADAKAYYGYLFEANKKPTKVMDALLRGIANYIVCYGFNSEETFRECYVSLT
jgi:hypothetical protein